MIDDGGAKPPFRIRGLAMEAAPQYLRPYLDCVDGALAVGGSIDGSGKPVAARWQLYRSGAMVGMITIPLD